MDNLEHGVLKKLFTSESSEEGDFDTVSLMIPFGENIEHKWSIDYQAKDGPIEFKMFLGNHPPHRSHENTFSPLSDGYHTDSHNKNVILFRPPKPDAKNTASDGKEISVR